MFIPNKVPVSKLFEQPFDSTFINAKCVDLSVKYQQNVTQYLFTRRRSFNTIHHNIYIVYKDVLLLVAKIVGKYSRI